jgi:hypothetical protein
MSHLTVEFLARKLFSHDKHYSLFFFKNEALREIGTKIDKSDYSILHHVTSLIYIELCIIIKLFKKISNL